MAAKRTRTIYRDRNTGRFVKRSTWSRSKAQGGTRYTRTSIRIVRKRKAPSEPSSQAFAQTYEWLVTFTYEATGRSLDVIATGRDEDEARASAIEFLASDKEGRKIFNSLSHWSIRTARGRRANEYREPEYRGESRE